MAGRGVNSFAFLDVEDTGAVSSEDDKPALPSTRSPTLSPSAKKAKAKKRQRERSAKGVAANAASANHSDIEVSRTSTPPPLPTKAEVPASTETPTDSSSTFAQAAAPNGVKHEPQSPLFKPQEEVAPAQAKEEPALDTSPGFESLGFKSPASDDAASSLLPSARPTGLTLEAPSMTPSTSVASSAPTDYDDETGIDETPFEDTAGEETDAGNEAADESAVPRTPRAAQRFGDRFQEEHLQRRRGSSATVRDDGPRARSPSVAMDQNRRPVEAADHGQDHAPNKKKQAIVTRTVTTLAMIGGFFLILYFGHIPMICLVFCLQALVYRELSALFDAGHRQTTDGEEKKAISPARLQRRASRDRWGRIVSWYFFATTNYFLYGETIIYYFKHIVLVDSYFIPFSRHHRLISVMLWMVGFVGFVASLNRNTLRRQFGLFCWIHMSLFLILGSSHFIVNNILEGLIWLWLPASVVIMNDVAAYVCGMAFGRHQLIKLSPKKTVEGFVGAIFATLVFAYVWATIFMRFNFMICPARELGVTAASHITCEINPVFAWHDLPLPALLAKWLTQITGRRIATLPWSPFQLHALVLAVFASLVAPFGGFFASGFKRAYNIKDFGDSIPGHGGMTDRMDCQFLMGMFTYFYYASFCRPDIATVGAVFERATSSLSTEQIGELVLRLQAHLRG